MSITDPHLSDCCNDKIEDIRNKRLKTFGTLFDGAKAIGQCHRQFVTSAVGMFHGLYFNILFLSLRLFLPFLFANCLCLPPV